MKMNQNMQRTHEHPVKNCFTFFELPVRLSKNVSINGNLQCAFKCSTKDEFPFLLKSFIKLKNKNNFIVKNIFAITVVPKVYSTWSTGSEINFFMQAPSGD